MGIATWFAATLRQYPEIAIFLTLGFGYLFRQIYLQGNRLRICHCNFAGRRCDRPARNCHFSAP